MYAPTAEVVLKNAPAERKKNCSKIRLKPNLISNRLTIRNFKAFYPDTKALQPMNDKSSLNFSDQEIISLRKDTDGCSQIIHLNNAGASRMPNPVTKSILD